jgi:hypothetical protein
MHVWFLKKKCIAINGMYPKCITTLRWEVVCEFNYLISAHNYVLESSVNFIYHNFEIEYTMWILLLFVLIVVWNTMNSCTWSQHCVNCGGQEYVISLIWLQHCFDWDGLYSKFPFLISTLCYLLWEILCEFPYLMTILYCSVGQLIWYYNLVLIMVIQYCLNAITL